MSTEQTELQGWELLTHGGLLVDAPRLRNLADSPALPLRQYAIEGLRRHYLAFQQERQKTGEWVAWVLEQVCGFGPQTGYWQRGSEIGTEWSRTSMTGEVIRPRQLWRGSPAGLLPVFIDDTDNIGRGKGRKVVSNVLQWMRASNVRLALLTNGRQWRLLYAGLDAEAWAEWDAERWFEEGALGKQVDMLRLFLAPERWQASANDQPSVLLQAVQDSRKGQADLSALLGERVREGVEMLLQAHGEQIKQHCGDVDTADIYRAAVRVVMRMVVVLFAESRDLLPRSNSLYHRAYGLNGLLEELEKHGGDKGERIAHGYGAWPRVLALFQLVYLGSPHPAMLIHAYGGELFETGEVDSPDGLKRALWVLENACHDDQVMSDLEVRKLLERISRTKVKVRQGKSATMVSVPVDFGDLGSEYIGILYEGLLDFELKAAPEGDPMIFLAVGNEPVLPLSRLEAMTDLELKSLLEKMKDTSKKEDGDEESESENQDQSELESDDLSEVERDDQSEVERESESDSADIRHSTRSRAEQWALRVVKIAGLVKKPKGTLTPEKQNSYEKEIANKAKSLVRRVVLPGEWFLVRWGGTRKGAGTFYTRPGLAVPTVHRTLRPLAYDAPTGANGEPDTLAPAALWTPKKPEDILALKVCDPACGSGSFPVAALRFLTEAVYAALHYHKRIQQDDDRSLVALLQDRPGAPESLGTELIPCLPEDETFEARLKARLRRHVVERCIYGVDLDPLGVELCRLALWVETMDRDLPFSFLDHKVKCGNGLVGAWFDQFQHYPVMAWKNREAGDKGHTNGVHFQKEAGTKRIKEWVRDVLTPDMALYVGKWSLFQGDIQDISIKGHKVGLEILAKLHAMPVHDSAERARIYRSEWLGNPEYQSLRKAMDLWCACWFWPADALDIAPLPTQFAKANAETLALSASIAAKKRFFHWELEFPDVFGKSGDGFAAMIGNPPWETAKPNSKEFFSNLDPLYRTYGKQEALLKQTEYFKKEEATERDWLDYSADFRAQSNFVGYSANAFGDPKYHADSSDKFGLSRGKDNDVLHQRWREARQKSVGYADVQHGFRHQGGGDVNLYKMFLEQAHTLLRVDGRIGLIVPSGIYSDYGSQPLRKLFLDQCQWVWLFGFENKYGIFEIHRSFKFNPVIIQKGGKTASIHTAFMRRNLEDWERAEDFAVPYDRSQVEQFSPKSLAILEIQGEKDLEILEKIYSNSVLLGDDGPEGWGVQYSREFDMTNDSKLFPPRPKWEEKGYRPDEYSRWLLGAWRPIAELWAEMGVAPLAEGARRVAQPPYDTLPIPRAEIPAGIILSREADAWIREEEVEDVALPLYEGRMIGQFDFSQKGWVSGKGRGSVWTEINWDCKVINPQFLMAKKDYYLGSSCPEYPKLSHMRVGSATNSRSSVAAPVMGVPTSDTTAIFYRESWRFSACIAGLYNSFAFDYITRKRLVGLHLDYHVFAQNPIPKTWNSEYSVDRHLAISLSFPGVSMASGWYDFISSTAQQKAWRSKWALKDYERTRMYAILDAMAFESYCLDIEGAKHILQDCDLPEGEANTARNDPKGFWRIDKEKDPELRHTVLTLVAFHDLQEKIKENGGDRDQGIAAFLNQNDGEGWQIPETLRLADYGLGHDERALEHQPVATRLGPRYYDWQLAQTAEESWKECHLHARNLLGEAGYQQLLDRIAAEQRGEKYEPPQEKKDDDDTDGDDDGQKPHDPQLKLF